MFSNLSLYIPKESIPLISKWIYELNISLKFVLPRNTKLGDYKYDNKNGNQITINNDLNAYATLITLTHEIAHAFVFKRYGSNHQPHGKEWKKMYKSLMLNFLKPEIFPHNILAALSAHMINPSASSSNDINLILSLREYDSKKSLTIDQIKLGEKFLYSGRLFVKHSYLRKRIKSLEVKSQKIYLFNPITKIEIVDCKQNIV